MLWIVHQPSKTTQDRLYKPAHRNSTWTWKLADNNVLAIPEMAPSSVNNGQQQRYMAGVKIAGKLCKQRKTMEKCVTIFLVHECAYGFSIIMVST